MNMKHPHKWIRAKEGRTLAGVCAGLGRTMHIDPVLLRVLWLGALLIFGVGGLIYLILAICLPREDRVEATYKKQILGVCVRLAQRQGWEPGPLRALFVILAITSCGAAILFYVGCHFLLPSVPTAT